MIILNIKIDVLYHPPKDKPYYNTINNNFLRIFGNLKNSFYLCHVEQNYFFELLAGVSLSEYSASLNVLSHKILYSLTTPDGSGRETISGFRICPVIPRGGVDCTCHQQFAIDLK